MANNAVTAIAPQAPRRMTKGDQTLTFDNTIKTIKKSNLLGSLK